MSKRISLLVIFALLAVVGAQAAFAECPQGTFSCSCNGIVVSCQHSIQGCLADCSPNPHPNPITLFRQPTTADIMLAQIMAPADSAVETAPAADAVSAL
jgi:hypothetical protein